MSFVVQGPLGFDVKIISGMDIIGVCKKRLKISPLELLERPDANAQARTAQELLQLVEENPEVRDWGWWWWLCVQEGGVF